MSLETSRPSIELESRESGPSLADYFRDLQEEAQRKKDPGGADVKTSVAEIPEEKVPLSGAETRALMRAKFEGYLGCSLEEYLDPRHTTPANISDESEE